MDDYFKPHIIPAFISMLVGLAKFKSKRKDREVIVDLGPNLEFFTVEFVNDCPTDYITRYYNKSGRVRTETYYKDCERILYISYRTNGKILEKLIGHNKLISYDKHGNETISTY